MKKSQKLSEKEKAKEEPAEEDLILPKAIWSGSLSMGLVNVPMKAIPITRDKRVSFKMIHETCGTPIHYKKYCEEGEEVKTKEIVHGYALGHGKYVIFTDEEIEAAQPESSDI